MNVLERASKYVSARPPAISGSGGHPACFAVAVALTHGFELGADEAWPIFLAYNERCEPPWSERELQHKLSSAGALNRHPKPRGHLRGCGEPMPPGPIAEVRILKVRWQDMVAQATGRTPTSKNHGQPTPPVASPADLSSPVTDSTPEAPAGVADILPGDEPGCLMLDRLAMIEGILEQRDGKGRAAYTAAQVESCRIGLHQHAGAHPLIDAMLARLIGAKKTALTWQVLAARR